MGCAQTKPSKDSPPRGLTKLKLENGYVKARRSTGQTYFNKESGRVLRPEARNGYGNYVSNGKSNLGTEGVREGKVMTTIDEGKKSTSGDGVVKDNVNRRTELIKKAEEDELLVDGWPKWLTDNIPREVLRNIVPKSADSYAKIEKLGQGTYSNVYKARDKDTGKIVALKKVRFDTSEPDSVKFMAREIMILLKLDHPNIVKLEGLATSRMQYSLYLVFDCMQSDLSRILSRPDERLTEPQVKCYMQQLLSGLQHCHERGILHRDLKGSNLLIDRNGMLKIADFGLANFYNPEKKRHLTTRVVTLWYRAPELLLGATDYGVGIDLWSVGCLMAEMFAGRPIMPGRTEVEQTHKIFKLCGTPPDEYYKRLKLSTSLKPPMTYKSCLRETFKNFPASSLSILSILLALDPAYRGSAASALQNEFFHTSPLACDLSGLPVIYTEKDDQDQTFEKRKHRTSKMRQRSHRERRKKNLDAEKQKDDVNVSKQEARESADIPVFSLKPGSSTTNSTLSVKPSEKEVSPPHLLSPATESHPSATKNIKNQPPLPNTMNRATNYNKNYNNMYRLDQVQRSISTREFRSLDKKNLLQLHAVDN
ncbi:Protein kinase superfamily protein [Abeliophyllum distichum]|uniref:Protein kinase superfamily protein n=1 Tax=Abeliophyllum distichum TaxID=126358 RepID=A0ABD1SSQ6_9LAMI